MRLLATPAHTPWRAWLGGRSLKQATGHRGRSIEEGAMTSGGKRYTNTLHAEATRWQHVAGEPTAADSAGPYSHEQLVRMDADFAAAVEAAFASGGESRTAAFATYRIDRRAA